MVFLDKIKEKAGGLKENAKIMGKITARINNSTKFYGNVNRGVKDGDFSEVCYVSIEDGKGVIYGTLDKEDYLFTAKDVCSFTFIGNGCDVQEHPSLRYMIEFTDGKKAQLDIIHTKVDDFKRSFNL